MSAMLLFIPFWAKKFVQPLAQLRLADSKFISTCPTSAEGHAKQRRGEESVKEVGQREKELGSDEASTGCFLFALQEAQRTWSTQFDANPISKATGVDGDEM